MKSVFEAIRYDWEVRYDSYIDDLIMFSPRFGRSFASERYFKRESNDMIVGMLGDAIGYLKIENASKYFDNEIDILSKNSIIKRVKELMYA